MKELQPTSVETTLEVVAVGLQAVPIVGGVLGGAISFALTKRKDQRIQAFVINLVGDLQKVKESINQDFVKKDEFISLTEEIIHRAGESWQKDKLAAFKSIYINTLISSKPKYEEAAEVIWLIHYHFQLHHLVLLKILANPGKAIQEMGTVVEKNWDRALLRELLPEWSSEQVDRTERDLIDRSVIQGYGSLRLTDFGQAVAHYLGHI